MKKKINLLLLFLIVAFVLVGCVGQPATQQPAPETYGWIVDDGEPTETENIFEGQMYLDSITFDLYQFSEGEWYFIGNIKGADGVNGINGKDGKDGKDGNITISEELTTAEFRQMPAKLGSFHSDGSEWRAKIEIKIPTKAGAVVKFLGDLSNYRWAVVESYDISNKTAGSYFDSGWNRSWTDPNGVYTSTYDGGYMVLTVGKMDANGTESKFTQDDLNTLHNLFEVTATKANSDINISGGSSSSELRYFMLSINHRGYCKEAPENTLSAYKLSAEKGFKYVECDISFTKDNVPVLLHDNTIDRTSNGSGKINELTYAEASQYDYSYDSSNAELEAKFTAYRGEKLPKFEEFIKLCKYLGLHPYIEIKVNSSEGVVFTQEQAQILIDIVTNYGMQRNVSWISFDPGALEKIVKIDSKARIGWVLNSLSSTKGAWNHIDTVDKFITGENQVFIDMYYTQATQATVDACKSKGVSLEVWCIDKGQENILLNLHPYVTGVSSNDMIAEDVLRENALK